MTILFTASEVGSARVLLPICELCEARKRPFIVYGRDYMARSCRKGWQCLSTGDTSANTIQRVLRENEVELVVFSVNIKDPFPLQVARAASAIGIPVIHVLDYWNAYRARMELDGEETFNPDFYLVPDEYAKAQAIKEGIHPESIQALGQPALADTIHWYQETVKTGDIDSDIKEQVKDKAILLFVSEPVAADQGESYQENIHYRGYTEKDVLMILAHAITGHQDDFYVLVLPHPRENIEALLLYWQEIGGTSCGSIIRPHRGRDLLPHAKAVIGMASTLLYEAWLLGIPVASIQPGLRTETLARIGECEGVFFTRDSKNTENAVSGWIENVLGSPNRKPYREEAQLHQLSTESIFNLMNEVIAKNRYRTSSTRSLI